MTPLSHQKSTIPYPAQSNEASHQGKQKKGVPSYHVHLELALDHLEAIGQALALPAEPVFLLPRKGTRLNGWRQAVLMVRSVKRCAITTTKRSHMESHDSEGKRMFHQKPRVFVREQALQQASDSSHGHALWTNGRAQTFEMKPESKHRSSRLLRTTLPSIT